jgi:hypothetical protein
VLVLGQIKMLNLNYMRKTATPKSHIPMLVFILFLSLATLFAVIVRKLGFTLESGFPKNETSSQKTAEIMYSKKLNFDPTGKFVYAVDVPINYVRKTNKELSGVNYPKELLALSDDDLYDVKCSPIYRSGGNGFEAFVRGVKQVMDSEMQKILNEKEQIAGAKIDYFQTCELENGEKFYTYGGTLNTGRTIYYFATKQNGNNVDLKIESSFEQPSICNNILAAKKDGIIYYHCGSDDGSTQTASIYAVDFVQRKIHRVIGCQLLGVTSGKEANVNCVN